MINFKNRQTYFYIGLILSGLASGIFCWRGLLPSFKERGVLKKEVTLQEKELQRRHDTLRENQKFKEEIQAIEKNYGNMDAMFFAKDDVSSAVKVIADISEDLKIEYISFVPQPVEKMENFPEGKTEFSLWKNPISIKIKTGYLKLVDFIGGIEKAKKLIKIESLKIKKNFSAPLIQDVEMTVYVFSLLR